MQFIGILIISMLGISNAQIEERSTMDKGYEELKELNASCSPLDTCKSPRFLDDIMSNDCTCESSCSQLGTCCIDSQYRSITSPVQKPTCRAVNDEDYGFLMIEQCPLGVNSSSALENLCRDEWNGEDDLMRTIPVTSLLTQITYKNYFCFRCHEANNEFLFWNVRLFTSEEYNVTEENVNVTLEFDVSNRTWVAPIGKGGSVMPVTFHLETPDQIFGIPKTCWPDVISNCSEHWEDDEILVKCSSYMAITRIEKDGQSLKYKNPHCALCNFEDLSNMICGNEANFKSPRKKPFSFSLLLDINQSDGDRVGKVQRCDDNEVWDPKFKKCRALVCALPKYVVRDGKCLPP